MNQVAGISHDRRERAIEAVATFTALMHAYERGELPKAADAQEALERLGIVVRFGRADTTRREAVANGADLRIAPTLAPPADDAERLLSFAEMCALLGIGEHKAWELCNIGELPGFKIGSRWKFRRAALIAWAEEREREAAR